MKTTLPEKSKPHEERIKQIANIIVAAGKDKIAFVILFGSFARGGWVFDRYSEDGILYQYASDYDFLIITKTAKQANGSCAFDLEKQIKKELENQGLISKYQGHNPHYIIEPIDRVNDDLEKSQYFFSDIKKEGIVLYDSGEFELSEPQELDEKKRKEIAKEDYEHWHTKAVEFLDNCQFNLNKAAYNNAAFQLHQTTESLYNCSLLTLTGYKPKSHDLEELNKLCSAHSHDFLTTFPTATKEQQDCFNLLQKAYIDARYNKHFKITKEQLEYLIARVEQLKELVEVVCRERI